MLKHHGYNVTILEKEDFSSRRGYDAGISIRDEVLDFLRKHDRVKRDMTIECPPGTNLSLDGKPTVQRGQTMTLTSWALLISILRATFDGTTSEAVPEAPPFQASDGIGIYISKARVSKLGEDGGRLRVEYENLAQKNEEKILTDIIIVADGSNSSVRKLLVANVERKYAGYMLWRGTAREELVDSKWNDLYSAKSTFSSQKGNSLLT